MYYNEIGFVRVASSVYEVREILGHSEPVDERAALEEVADAGPELR